MIGAFATPRENRWHLFGFPYRRFTLSCRDVEDLLAECGREISDETVQRWVLKFGPLIARKLWHGRPRPSERWHLDELVVRIARKPMYLWRARRSPRHLFSRQPVVAGTGSDFMTTLSGIAQRKSPDEFVAERVIARRRSAQDELITETPSYIDRRRLGIEKIYTAEARVVEMHDL